VIKAIELRRGASDVQFCCNSLAESAKDCVCVVGVAVKSIIERTNERAPSSIIPQEALMAIPCNKHAPLITKLSDRKSKPNHWLTPTVCTFTFSGNARRIF